MIWIKKVVFFILSFVPIMVVYGEPSYILCIDGGGSKTIFQVIDREGQIIPLIKNEINMDKIAASGSNINIVGIDGIRAILRTLFEDVIIGDTELAHMLSNCQVVAGMAGAGLPANKQMITSLFKEWGISEEHILVMSDAEMALQLVQDQGIILISGTGSICLGKKDQKLFRVGGLGRILGDEGSGYQIGLQALKAVLAEEYGWGNPTSLTLALREFFSVNELKILIPQINLGEILPAKIASLSSVVFQKACEGDLIALEIVNRAAYDLGNLLATMLKISHLSNCEIHLWGGIFKSRYSDDFIQKIVNQATDTPENLRIINYADYNVALLFASKFL